MAVANRTTSKNARNLQVADVLVADLHPWPRNPRRIRPERLEQLQAMLSASPEMLQARPLIALPDGTVIAGNQRLAAVVALGWETVPCVYADLDEATATRWAFADNNAMGESDDDLAAQLLAELETGGADLLLTGFAPDETSRLLASLRVRDVDPDAVPEPPAEPRSVRGEVYELGTHRLMCGDATSAKDVEVLMLERASLLFTSPPYLDAREYGGDKDLEVSTLVNFLPLFANQCDLLAINLGIIRRDSEIVRFWDDYLAAASSSGLKLLAWNVWDRGQPWSMAQNTAMFPIEHEFVFVFGERTKKLNRTVANKTPGLRTGITNRQPDGSLERVKPKRVRDFRALGTVFRSPPHIGKDIGHPAMFPIVFPLSYLEAVTSHREVVVDPFAGSGSTLIAAESLDRRCFAMEIDPAYCDVIRQRYADYVGDQQWAP